MPTVLPKSAVTKFGKKGLDLNRKESLPIPSFRTTQPEAKEYGFLIKGKVLFFQIRKPPCITNKRYVYDGFPPKATFVFPKRSK